MVIRFTIDPVLNKVFNTFLNLKGNIMSKVKTVVLNDSYINRLDQLSNIRNEYETKTLRGSNKELYKILSDVYSLFIEIDSNKKKYDIEKLKEILKQRGFKLQKKSPILTLLIRYVFNSDRTRSYNYNRVISFAHLERIPPYNLPEFIESQGGIEECKKRFVQSDDSLKKVEKKKTEIENVLNYIDNFESLSNINLGNTKLEIKNDCKLIITIGRLSSDQKSVELFKVLDPTNKPLENKILNIISRDLNKQIEQSKVQTQKTLESVSS